MSTTVPSTQLAPEAREVLDALAYARTQGLTVPDSLESWLAERGTQTVRVAADPEAARLNEIAKRIAPGIRSPYQPHEARSFVDMVGDRDPIAYVFGEYPIAEDDARTKLVAWTLGDLEKSDPVAKYLRARASAIGADVRARNLWGRKIGAYALALSEVRADAATDAS